MSTRSKATKRAYHHGDLPRALVVAALELIERKGADALTLREVTSAVGVTHGAAYRHFEDKTALLAAIAEEGYRLLAQRLSETSRRLRTPRTRLRAIACEYVAFALERPAHYRVMWGQRLNEDGRFESLEQAIEQVSNVLIAEIVCGMKSGSFRRMLPQDAAILIWSFGHGFVDLVLRRRIKVKSPIVAVNYFGSLIDPLIDGFAAKSRLP